MNFPFPALVIFMGIIVILSVLRTRSARKSKNAQEDFWQAEIEANAVPRQDISGLDYIKIPDEFLQFCDLPNDDMAEEYKKDLSELSEKKILNLTGYTNTELKKLYGAPNINLLTEYDENFTRLARTLNGLGLLLKDTHFSDEAKQVLSFAVSCGSDITATYTQLALLCKKSGDDETLRSLQNQAAQLKSLSRTKILEQLSRIA